MKYLLLLNNAKADSDRYAGMTEEEAQTARAAEIPKWVALMERMEAGGQRLSGLELDAPDTAKVVRIVDGETVVTDGPYAETKEIVGGLMTVKCADLDEAIELAASIPLASRGSVEIRPIDE